MHRPAPVLITLGSNIDPGRNLGRALELLRARLAVRAVSRVFESAAVGAAGAPPFLNAAVLVATDLPPRALKYRVLRPLEARLGRRRTADRNAPRTIDLDLALYGDLVLDDPEDGLVLPDPQILTCAHVALPLADLAPDARHPVTGQTLAEIADRFADTPAVQVRGECRLAVP